MQKCHLGPRRGSLGALSGGLGGYLGHFGASSCSVGVILRLSWENLRATLVNREVCNSCEMKMVAFTRVLLVFVEHTCWVRKCHLGQYQDFLGTLSGGLGANLCHVGAILRVLRENLGAT